MIRKIRYFILDTIDSLLGRRDELTPPRRMLAVGDWEFGKVGREFLRHFTDLAGLQPSERVLDVGCGIGRMAVPLARYLDDKGSYEGFDIMADWVNWCSNKISPKYPNFRFQFADVFNQGYNPKGKCEASEYQFPYENESFDFVFLTSVFTHMLPQDMENYLGEITRVLKTDGRCLITFFLLNEESLRLIEAGKSALDFRYDIGGCRTIDESNPESAIAYDEEFIRQLYEKHGLNIAEPIRYGSWCGREKFLSYQDIVIATRK